MGITEEEKNSLIQYRVEKSKDVFQEALDVAGLNHWNLTVNRLYYAVFHLSSALLLRDGHTARTHSGIIRMIMMNYVRTGLLSTEEGELITSLFNMRQTGDYDDLYDWTRKQIEPMIEPTKNLLEKLESILSYRIKPQS